MERRRDVSCPVALRAGEHAVRACVCGYRSTVCAVIHACSRKKERKQGAVKATRGISVIQHCNKSIGKKKNKLAACIHDDGKK